MNASDPKSKLASVLAELKKEYLEKFPQKLQTLKILTDRQNWKALEDEYHKLKGTGKTYGFPEISTICQRLEDLAHESQAHSSQAHSSQNQAQAQNTETFQKALTLLEKIYQGYLKNESVDLDRDSFARSLLALKVK